MRPRFSVQKANQKKSNEEKITIKKCWGVKIFLKKYILKKREKKGSTRINPLTSQPWEQD